MPKKIKEQKKVQYNKDREKLLNVNNIHYVIILLLLIGITSVVIFGIYKYNKDKYHEHKSVAITKFEYSETIEHEGFKVYSVDNMRNGEFYFTYSEPGSNNNMKAIGETKFLDFNEELYKTGILDNESEILDDSLEYTWRIVIEIGSEEFFYSNVGNESLDRSKITDLIFKYFGKTIGE